MSWALNTRTSDSRSKHNIRSRLPDVMLSSRGQYTWNLAQVVEEALEEIVEDALEEIVEDEPITEEPEQADMELEVVEKGDEGD